MSGEVKFKPGYVFDESGEPVTVAKLNALIENAVGELLAESITARELADGIITPDKLVADFDAQFSVQDGSIFTSKLVDGAVTTNKIASRAVTTEKLANGSVTGDKLAEGAVRSNMIRDGSVTFDKLADASGYWAEPVAANLNEIVEATTNGFLWAVCDAHTDAYTVKLQVGPSTASAELQNWAQLDLVPGHIDTVIIPVPRGQFYRIKVEPEARSNLLTPWWMAVGGEEPENE